MEIIKRINARKAWVQVSDTEARLMTFDRDKTTVEMQAEGDKVKAKKDRLKQVQERIKNLQNGINHNI